MTAPYREHDPVCARCGAELAPSRMRWGVVDTTAAHHATVYALGIQGVWLGAYAIFGFNPGIDRGAQVVLIMWLLWVAAFVRRVPAASDEGGR